MSQDIKKTESTVSHQDAVMVPVVGMPEIPSVVVKADVEQAPVRFENVTEQWFQQRFEPAVKPAPYTDDSVNKISMKELIPYY